MNQLQAFEKKELESMPTYGQIPEFRAGDTVRVHVRILGDASKKSGKKDRIQAFEGVCIARKHGGLRSSFRVRKLLAGEWIERLFPLYSPMIKIERVRQGVVRRAKLYYLRGREGKAAKIRERLFISPKKKAALEAAAQKKKALQTAAMAAPSSSGDALVQPKGAAGS